MTRGRPDPAAVAAFLGERGLAAPERLVPLAPGGGGTDQMGCAVGGRRYVLFLFPSGGEARGEETLGLLEALAAREFPCPRPLRAGGRLLGVVAGRPAALAAVEPGEAARTLDEGRMEALGRTLAGLHRAGEDLGFARAWDGSARTLLPRARALAGVWEGRAPAQAAALREEAAFQEALPEGDLPGGLIHGAPSRGQFLFDARAPRVRVLLGFGLAGNGPWLADLAGVLLDAGWGGRGVVGDRARALLRGYRAGRPVEGAEYRWMPAHLRRAALTALCRELEEAAQGPPSRRAVAAAERLQCLRDLREAA